MKTIFVFNAIKGDIFPSTKLCFFSQLKLTSFEVLDYKRKQNCIKFYKNIRINVYGI